MNINLIIVGKTEEKFLNEGIDMYLNRLKHYINFNIICIPELKNVKSFSQEQIKVKEGEKILEKINTSDELILLDEVGKEFNSVGFSNFIQTKINSGLKTLTFVIGGAYGFSDDVYKRGNQKIALSQLTFSHQMVRLFFVEQVYRAFTIIKNEKYHHQ